MTVKICKEEIAECLIWALEHDKTDMVKFMLGVLADREGNSEMELLLPLQITFKCPYKSAAEKCCPFYDSLEYFTGLTMCKHNYNDDGFCTNLALRRIALKKEYNKCLNESIEELR